MDFTAQNLADIIFPSVYSVETTQWENVIGLRGVQKRAQWKDVRFKLMSMWTLPIGRMEIIKSKAYNKHWRCVLKLHDVRCENEFQPGEINIEKFFYPDGVPQGHPILNIPKFADKMMLFYDELYYHLLQNGLPLQQIVLANVWLGKPLWTFDQFNPKSPVVQKQTDDHILRIIRGLGYYKKFGFQHDLFQLPNFISEPSWTQLFHECNSQPHNLFDHKSDAEHCRKIMHRSYTLQDTIDEMTKKMPPTFMNATGQIRDFSTEHNPWHTYIYEVLYKGEYPVIPVTSLQGSQLTYRSRSIVNAIYPF